MLRDTEDLASTFAGITYTDFCVCVPNRNMAEYLYLPTKRNVPPAQFPNGDDV